MSAFRYAAYPLLIAGNALVAVYALTHGLELGPVNLLAMLGTILYLAAVERIIPYRRSWQPTGREWARDGLYFFCNMMIGGGVQGLLGFVTVSLAAPETALPLVPETLLCLAVSSFFGYLFHRVGHVHRWLWKVHGVHHVPGKVNLANNSVVHFVDLFGSSLATGIPIVLLGFSERAVFLVTMFIVIHGYLSHCNADIRLGWLNLLVSGPEQHRLHHSVRIEEAGHYGTDVSIWDHLFGSFTWRPGRAPAAVGVLCPEEFPAPSSMLASALHPFRRRRGQPETLAHTRG
jgi:sterol desaturase/sphingolipid hydroxylase (fatty acid hydroxylase superfamily)